MAILPFARLAASAIIVILILPTALLAGSNESYVTFESIDAEKLIAECWAISDARRATGITGMMRYGAADSVGCLEKVVSDQAEAMFEPETVSKNDIQDWLDSILEGYQKFYWAIYNSHRGCSPQCGTIYHVFHLSKHASLLEKMIRDMAKQRNKYEIGSGTGN